MSFGKGEGEWGGNQNTESSKSSCLLHWPCTVLGSSVFSTGEVNCAHPLFPSETPPKAGLDLKACLKWETLNYLTHKLVLLKCWWAEATRRWGVLSCSFVDGADDWGHWFVTRCLVLYGFDEQLAQQESKSAFHQHLQHGTKAWKSRCLWVPKASSGKTK